MAGHRLAALALSTVLGCSGEVTLPLDPGALDAAAAREPSDGDLSGLDSRPRDTAVSDLDLADSDDDGSRLDAAIRGDDTDGRDRRPEAVPGDLETRPDGPLRPVCPVGMVPVDDFCIDRYEAPNRAGQLPFVMSTFYEAEHWCEARGKRLCFDDEWELACAGPEGYPYAYGESREPGRCNDEESWRVYTPSLLQAWPRGLDWPAFETLESLLEAVRAQSPAAAESADHIEALYQGEAAGENGGCSNELGAFDLLGNIEEWTRRRDGGDGPDFSGNLKGRYWAESRTCQSNVRSHGNPFRFYEIGFRCCADR